LRFRIRKIKGGSGGAEFKELIYKLSEGDQVKILEELYEFDKQRKTYIREECGSAYESI